MAEGSKSVDTGSKIIVAGLFIQVMFFGVFMFVAWHFHRSIRPHRQFLTIGWKKHMVALYIVSLLIFGRSIFRIVQYCMGFNGYLQQHEVFLYVFDSTLMFGVMMVLNYIHPGEIASLASQVKRGGSQEFVTTAKTAYAPVEQIA
jgi:hypothetical protein